MDKGGDDKGSARIVYFGNEFPSDDIKEVFRRLIRHSKDRRFRQLAAFLEETTLVLKQEVSKLPQPLQDLVPHFDTALTLVEHGDFRQGPLGAAMESALLTVLELGLLIGDYEAADKELDLAPQQTTLVGLSIGLLAAAAVALSGTLAELARNGAESVRVSFRLGVYVDDMSRSLESPQPDGGLQSWAHVVTELTQESVEGELARFNGETQSPELTKVFVSAADKVSVSVSGPPSRLRAAMHHSHALRYSKSMALPVYDGLCHARHLYSEPDIEAVINGDESVVPGGRPVRLPLLSSQTGEPFTAATAAELWVEIGAELLTGTIYVDSVTTGVVGRVSGACHCRVDAFRTSLTHRGILGALEAGCPGTEVGRHDLAAWVHGDFGARQARSAADAKLAIVGMACRMPGGANDPELLWELLEQGRDTMSTVPPDRFDLATHFDPTGKTENATQTPYMNAIDRPGFFDAAFFHMSPREAEQTDPMHRLALVTAYEALEMAGVVPGRTASSRPQRIGTFYGQASDDWRELNASQNIGTYAVPGGERAFANGRINYVLGLAGPSFSIDTACSSGLAAVQAACSALWAGEADTVVAGGLNVITDPDNFAGLCNGHFLSKTGQCKVWDVSADGYCRADGIGSVVIKRLDDAEADNDRILAVVLSAATNHSPDAISITHPHAGAQRDNYRTVMQRAGVNPLHVSYVELHGTGTQAGDAVESESVSDVFAPAAPRRRPDQRLHLGAVKCNIGHGEAAAGIASLLKVLLMYQKNLIPAHIGIRTEPNPTLPRDLDRRNAGLAMANTPWPRPPGFVRFAVVNSFGAHGGNTTLLLEDAPLRSSTPGARRSTYPVVLSARSKKSLQGNAERLLDYLDQHPDTDLADLSYTTCARRIHHHLRIATVASSISGLQSFLRSTLDSQACAQVTSVPNSKAAVVFAFTGQGAFYHGIARDLYAEFPCFRDQVQRLDRLVERLGFPSVLPIVKGIADEEPVSIVLAQLSLVVVEIALARFWAVLGVTPCAVIGHSLGEYAALVVAGVVSAADALYLVGRRARLTEERCSPGSHLMLSVRATAEDLETIVPRAKFAYEVACRNTHHDTVIGGSSDDVAAVRCELEANSYKCSPVDVPMAFHTAQMDPILDTLEDAARNVPFKAPSIPVLSPLLSAGVFDAKSINADYFRRAAREPVDFVGAVEAARDLAIADDKTLWVDIGPHPLCSSFLRSIMPQARVVASCRRNEDNMATMAKSLVALHLAGLTPCWTELFRPNEHDCSLLHLPKYSWNETNYWIDYIGTWTMDKALLRDGTRTSILPVKAAPPQSSLQTSLIHQVTYESVDVTTASLHVQSDLQHPDFSKAVYGHAMNNCGVATSSIWTDMALTIGEHLYRRLLPQAKEVHMNLCHFEVLHAQVASKVRGSRHPLAVEAHLDLAAGAMSLSWFNVSTETNQRNAEWFATGQVRFEDASAWKAEWSRVQHLVLSRIETLEKMAVEGRASRLSKPLAYALFNNLVDYADHYRGMDSVVLHELEAYADVTLVPERHGSWHTPPHWIDSVSHIAGLIMNGSDASNTRDYFYVTPGCDSFRLLGGLEPGAKYRSYVRMFPLPNEANMYAGDLYILQRDIIVGMVGQIRFRRVPRLLMDRFFSPPESHSTTSRQDARPSPAHSKVNGIVQPSPTPTKANGKAPAPVTTANKPPPSPLFEISTNGKISHHDAAVVSTTATATNIPTPAESESGVVSQCLQLMARETGLDMADLTKDATFVQLGIDSLMSLVLSEKFRTELGIDVKSSVFLECPTIGDMTNWLDKNC